MPRSIDDLAAASDDMPRGEARLAAPASVCPRAAALPQHPHDHSNPGGIAAHHPDVPPLRADTLEEEYHVDQSEPAR